MSATATPARRDNPAAPAVLDSLRALMAGVIDYAGLFPPAALPLDAAVRNYASYLNDARDRWMLGRFICPAARLDELVPYVGELFAAGEPLAVSALGRGGANPAEFAANLKADLDAIAAFRAAAGDRAIVDVLETRLPATDPAAVLDILAESCRAAGLRPFAEAGFAGDWRATLGQTLCAIAGRPGLGYKLRAGGVEASAFPSPEQVAFAIVSCARGKIPMKFTAGLHHPVRHFNESVNATMHGFGNVFLACAFAWAKSADEAMVRRILEAEAPCPFVLRDYGAAFGDAAVSTEQIARARREFATSFGSCSFDEPREDLRAMGML